MTEQGIERIFRFIGGVWPTAPVDKDVIHAWRIKLDRYDDDRVMQAVFDLAGTHKYLPAISDVQQRCTEIGREAALQLDAETRRELTPFGEDPTNPHDREWNALDPDEQDEWIDRALGEWPPLPSIRRESSVIRARAAYLARTAQ